MKNELVLPSLPNSSIHIAGLTEHTVHDVCSWHLHNEYEVLWVFEGRKDFLVGENRYCLKAGDIIFLGSRVPHEVIAYQGCCDLFVQFESEQYPGEEFRMGTYLSRFLDAGGAGVRVFHPGEVMYEELRDVLQRIAEEERDKKPSYEIYLKGYVYQLLAILSRNGLVSDPAQVFDIKSVKRLLPVLTYLDEHYHEQISLEELGEIMNLNPSYFCRLFQKAANTSVMQYLNFVRVCKAERMLRKSGKSISQIAIDCGFSSVAYFNRVFRKYRNCTPSFYRKIKQ